MNPVQKRAISWVCIGAFTVGLISFPRRSVRADIFGGDVAVLVQILAETIQEIQTIEQVVGATRQTVGILEDMNRGVSQVLRLANTAHIPLSPQVYAQAATLQQAIMTSEAIYGDLSPNAPTYARMHYRSGAEGLYLSQDAFGYSSFLDRTGESVKTSAVEANQAAATRLTAETLGVVLEGISHSNRLQAKSLEISSTNRLESSQQDSARYESFVDTHVSIEDDLRACDAPDLNAFGGGGSP